MWVAPPRPPELPITVIISKTTLQSRRTTCAVAISANSRQRRLHRSAPPQNVATQGTRGLGRAVLCAFKSSVDPPDSKSAPANPTPKHEQERELRGSDVLWAMQRAAAEKSEAKNRKKSKRKGSSASGVMDSGRSGGTGDAALDYSKVRPLCIKSDWKTRLDELGRRLQELSETRLS